MNRIGMIEYTGPPDNTFTCCGQQTTLTTIDVQFNDPPNGEGISGVPVNKCEVCGETHFSWGTVAWVQMQGEKANGG